MIKIFIALLISNSLPFASENDSLFWFDVKTLDYDLPYFPLIINKVFTGNHLSVIDSMKKKEEKEFEIFRIQGSFG